MDVPYVAMGVHDPDRKPVLADGTNPNQTPVGSDVNLNQNLWLYVDNLSAGLPQQWVRVVVRHVDGKVLSDQDVLVGAAKEGDSITSKGIALPKGSNVATLLPSKKGPCVTLIGFYVV